MKSLFTILFSIVLFSVHSQNCEVYIPTEQGTTLTYVNKDAKGKKESDMTQTLVSVTQATDGTVYKVHAKVVDNKNKVLESDAEYKCTGNKFVFDMKSFVSKEQLDMFKDGNYKVEVTDMDIPMGVTPGTTLPDGKIVLSMTGDSPVKINMTTTITDRKILAKESVTNSAGTFDCIKISQTVISDMGIMKVTVKSVSWYALNIGMIKSETYSKSDKLMGTSELTAIKK
jgi:hypothetical protein